MSPDQQHLQERLTELARKHGVVGASLAVRLGDEEAVAATGVLNLRTQQPATPESVFQFGSITKVWTATLVMQLVDEGLLDLDEPVVRYLPEFRVASPALTAAVTTRHLLDHTSGIDGDYFPDFGRGDDCLARYVEGMAGLEQVHPLGATMSNCNTAVVLLGGLQYFFWERFGLSAEASVDVLGAAFELTELRTGGVNFGFSLGIQYRF